MEQYKKKHFITFLITSVLFEANLFIFSILFRNFGTDNWGLWSISNFLTFFLFLIIPQESLLFGNANLIEKKTKIIRAILSFSFDITLLLIGFYLAIVPKKFLIFVIIANFIIFLSFYLFSIIFLYIKNKIDDNIIYKLIEDSKKIKKFDINAFLFSYLANKNSFDNNINKNKLFRLCHACSCSGYLTILYIIIAFLANILPVQFFTFIILISLAIISLAINIKKLMYFSSDGIKNFITENLSLLLGYTLLFLSQWKFAVDTINIPMLIIYFVLFAPLLMTQVKIYETYKNLLSDGNK